MLYLAATLSRSICAGTHFSLQVARLAVRSRDVALALDALWMQTTPSFCYQQYNRLREELPECVLAVCFTKPLTFTPKWKCCHYLLTPMSLETSLKFRWTPNTEVYSYFPIWLKLQSCTEEQSVKENDREISLSPDFTTGSLSSFHSVAMLFMKNYSPFRHLQ